MALPVPGQLTAEHFCMVPLSCVQAISWWSSEAPFCVLFSEFRGLGVVILVKESALMAYLSHGVGGVTSSPSWGRTRKPKLGFVSPVITVIIITVKLIFSLLYEFYLSPLLPRPHVEEIESMHNYHLLTQADTNG